MTRARKVLMVAACPFPYRRGTPIRIERMADAVARRGHEVHVVCYHLGELRRDAPFRIHRICDVRSYRKTSAGPTYRKLAILDPLLAMKVRGLLRHGSFDLIHAHHYEGLLVALAARGNPRLPVVFDAHTLLESELPYYTLGLPRGAKRWIGSTLDRRLPRRADHVVAVAAAIRDKLIHEQGLAEDAVTVIPNGVDYERFETAPDAVGATTGGQRLIFTGNMAPYQGIDRMLEALSIVRRERPDARLLIVTEESFEPYERLAEALGVRAAVDVKHATFEDVPALLASAEVALNPREECDGVPQKLLNYMVAGKPVVSFAGSAKHQVDGEHGLVVENGDTAAFARAVLRLLDAPDRSRRMGAQGRELVRSRLSWDSTARQVEAVYERLS